MDKRILTKVKVLESAKQNRENVEAAKKAKEAAEHKAYVESKLPQARKWVEERLLDLVAQEIAKPYSYDWARNKVPKELDLSYCDEENNGNKDIPVEAKFIAAGEIDGLITKQNWVEPDNDPDGPMYAGHFCYRVTWIQR